MSVYMNAANVDPSSIGEPTAVFSAMMPRSSLRTSQREVDVTGIDNHELNALKIVDATAKVTTQLGDAILILRQCAYHGIDRTIHSAGQIEFYKNVVYDRSIMVGGTQHIKTKEGCVIPLDVINGLPYLKMIPNTDAEWESLPHINLTSGDQWDPRALDHTLTDKPDWYNSIKDLDELLVQTPFDQFGNYRHRTPTTGTIVIPDSSDNNLNVTTLRAAFHDASNLNRVYTCLAHDTPAPREVTTKPIDCTKYRPYFLHVSNNKI